MHHFATRIAKSPMSPDEQPFFKALGQRIAKARTAADLTQVQLAEALGISQPQLAFYEVGKRRVPVSMLPSLAKALKISVEMLVGDDGEVGASAIPPRRTKRGPPSRLERQLDAVAQLPKGEQKMVSELIDAMLTRHHAQTGQEAANAP